jgi:hypothetical protein
MVSQYIRVLLSHTNNGKVPEVAIEQESRRRHSRRAQGT